MQTQKIFNHVVYLSLLCIFWGCGSNTAILEANKEIVGRFSDAINNKQFELLDDLVVENFVRHSQATSEVAVTNRDQFIELQNEYLSVFPDQKITINTMIAEDDYVAVNAIYTGTQDGPMQPYPATGNKVSSNFLALFRIQNGKIAEMWVEWDNLAILTQLGLFPPPPVSAK